MLESTKKYHVICAPGVGGEPALSRPDGKDCFCITISEDKSKITFQNWSTVEMSGEEIENMLPSRYGIVLVEDLGGRYIPPKDQQ